MPICALQNENFLETPKRLTFREKKKIKKGKRNFKHKFSFLWISRQLINSHGRWEPGLEGQK